jgi:Fe-Mn family superoxide dismutase
MNKFDKPTMLYSLEPLPYAFDALEPYIDTRTMEIHHNKHEQAYINNLNAALASYPELQNLPLVMMLKNINTLPDTAQTAVRNNGGGVLNHNMFWTMMKKDGGGEPKGAIGDAIKKKFGSFEAFKEQFSLAAKSVFGSGWAWLVVDPKGDLRITTTPNQDSPFSEGMFPIMGLDVWEHAYYLLYQNRRPDYISAWWHVINWEQIEENYKLVL